MPPQGTREWLEFLETEAQARDVAIDTDLDGRIWHFHLWEDPGNAILLDWTRHMAFNVGLWTFGESG